MALQYRKVFGINAIDEYAFESALWHFREFFVKESFYLSIYRCFQKNIENSKTAIYNINIRYKSPKDMFYT